MPATEPSLTNSGLPSTLWQEGAGSSFRHATEHLGGCCQQPLRAVAAQTVQHCRSRLPPAVLRDMCLFCGATPHSLFDLHRRALAGGHAGAVCQVSQLVGGGQHMVQLHAGGPGAMQVYVHANEECPRASTAVQAACSAKHQKERGAGQCGWQLHATNTLECYPPHQDLQGGVSIEPHALLLSGSPQGLESLQSLWSEAARGHEEEGRRRG